MTICTWNSQGNPLNNDDKTRILQQLYCRYDVLLLQECGNLNIYINSGVNVVDGDYLYRPQAGAFNIRCSSCIISKLPIKHTTSQYLQSGSGRSMIGAFLTQEKINIYNIHAVSGGIGAADVISSLNHCQSPFILGGDMNCTPDSLKSRGRSNNRSLLIGTSSRYKNVILATTGMHTTKSFKEYDYFIHSDDLTHQGVERHTSMGGDHYPVFATFSKKIYR